MSDNPDSAVVGQNQNQPNSDTQEVNQDGQNQQVHDNIASLRRKKRTCKTQLTKAKLLLTSLLCASEKQIESIRSAVDNVLRHNEEVLDVLNHLCDEDVGFEDELESVQSDSSISELLSRATELLSQIPRDTSPVTVPDPTFHQQNGPAELPHGYQENRPTEQSTNSHFNQLDRDLYRQLSKVSITKFNGNKREYQVFKDAFTECIDKSSTSKAYKMLQLRQHLTGEALKAIEGFQASDIGYDAALKRLEDKFGGPRRYTLMHLETIMKMNSVNFSDLKKFEEYVDTLELCILSLQENGRTEEFHVNSMFFSVVRSKLSPNALMQFKRWAASERKTESLLTLKEWLSLEVRYRVESQEEVEGFTPDSKPWVSSSYPKPSSNSSYRNRQYNSRNSKTFATTSQNSCIVCGQFHDIGINNCSYFKTLSVTQRWEIAKEKRLCFRCLGYNHRGNKCTVAQQCRIDGCRRTHHYLLHGGGYDDRPLVDSFNRNIEPSLSQPTNSYKAPALQKVEPPQQIRTPPSARNDHSASKDTHTQVRKLTNLVMRIIPVVIRNRDKAVRCNALMDDCSTDSYINENVAAELGLKGEIADLDVSVLGGKSTSLNAALVSAELCSLDFKTCVPFTAYTVNNVTGGLRTVDWNNQAYVWPHLKGISFPQITDNRVDLLIGLNVFGIHRAITEITGLPHEPVARLTPLGWTCTGPAEPAHRNGNFSHFTYHIKTESDVDTLIRNMWDIENSGLKPKTSNFTKSEIEAVKSTELSLTYDSNANRYSVGIPWNFNYRKLLSTSNFENAESRLISLERSLAKKPEVADIYSNIIKDHLLKGYITEVPGHSLPSWYLPHFAVVRMDKTTTKVRMVLDAAARTNGVSLNDCINPGPKLQRSG